MLTCVPRNVWPQGVSTRISSALDALYDLGQVTCLWPSIHPLTSGSLASVVLNFFTTKNSVIFFL